MNLKRPFIVVNPNTMRAIRRSLCLSQSQVGSKVGVSQQTISQFETGKRSLPYGKGAKLKAYLTDSYIDLLDRRNTATQ